MRIGPLLAHLDDLEGVYARTLRQCAGRYADEHDVHHQCLTFAAAADRAAVLLGPLRKRYDGVSDWRTVSPEEGTRLLEDLRSVHLMADAVAVTWTMALQAAKALRDSELKDIATSCQTEAETEAKWFLTRIKTSAPQALVTQ